MIAAYFDMDDTLIKGNGGSMMGKYLVMSGKFQRLLPNVTIESTTGLIEQYLAYKNMTLDYRKLLEAALTPFVGMSKEELSEMGREAFKSFVKPSIFKGALRRINMHRKAGHKLVLMTANLSWIVQPMSEYLEFDHWFCTMPVFENGLMTTELHEPVVFGGGKKIIGEDLAEKEGYDLSKSYFYSDSIDDSPFLSVVGNPVAVCPDPKLRALAKEKGWRIRDFGETLAG